MGWQLLDMGLAPHSKLTASYPRTLQQWDSCDEQETHCTAVELIGESSISGASIIVKIDGSVLRKISKRSKLIFAAFGFPHTRLILHECFAHVPAIPCCSTNVLKHKLSPFYCTQITGTVLQLRMHQVYCKYHPKRWWQNGETEEFWGRHATRARLWRSWNTAVKPWTPGIFQG